MKELVKLFVPDDILLHFEYDRLEYLSGIIRCV